MSTELVSLSGLADEINAAHDATLDAAKSTVLKAVAVGELLAKAKERVPHGQWRTWVEAKCRFGARQAQKYLRCYENRTVLEEQMRTGGSHLGVNSLLATIAEPAEKPGRDRMSRERAQEIVEHVRGSLWASQALWDEAKAKVIELRGRDDADALADYLAGLDAAKRGAILWAADHPEASIMTAVKRYPEVFDWPRDQIHLLDGFD